MLILPAILLFAAVAQAQDASQNQPTSKKVIYLSTDPAITYLRSCPLDNAADCRGAWWTEHDPKYTSGVVRVNSGPDPLYNDIEPYMSFTFTGTGFSVYQWVNKTSAAQTNTLDTRPGVFQDFVTSFNWAETVNEEATLTKTWSQTGLKPGKHMIGIQHTKMPGRTGYMVIDHIEIDEVELVKDPNANRGKIIGGAVAGSLVGALIIGFLFFLHWRNRAVQARRKAQEAKLGSVVTPQAPRFMNPSAEIQASEKLYAEARREEQEERRQKSNPRSDSPV